jgi:hypothetical protein
MRYEERFILRQREWRPDGKTDFLILSREIKLGFSNAAEVKRARSFLALQSVTDESYYSLQWTKCYSGGTSRSARSESEVTGAAFVSEKRSEHRRTALKGANFVCVEAGFLDGSQG